MALQNKSIFLQIVRHLTNQLVWYMILTNHKAYETVQFGTGPRWPQGWRTHPSAKNVHVRKSHRRHCCHRINPAMQAEKQV